MGIFRRGRESETGEPPIDEGVETEESSATAADAD